MRFGLAQQSVKTWSKKAPVASRPLNNAVLLKALRDALVNTETIGEVSHMAFSEQSCCFYFYSFIGLKRSGWWLRLAKTTPSLRGDPRCTGTENIIQNITHLQYERNLFQT